MSKQIRAYLGWIAVIISLTSSGQLSGVTYDLQSYIYCPIAMPFCGYPDEASMRFNYFQQIGEMNLEYATSGMSFRALNPIVAQDNRFSTMSGPKEALAGNGETNAALQNELMSNLGAPNANRVTMFLGPNFGACWNGIPCPGADDGFDGDDVIFCYPPGGSIGRTYAHEMGHYWCLRHPFTFQDAPENFPPNHEGDATSCSTLINVPDTPADPGVKEVDNESGGSDEVNGNLIEQHEWCNTTELTSVDPGSPHDSRCSIGCVKVSGGVTIATGYSPFPWNAMSYYNHDDCRAPYVTGGQRTEAFTIGQINQFLECRQKVPVRTQLVDVCFNRGGDSDHDGWCDIDDACPLHANTSVVDSDSDGVPDVCDLCTNAPDPSNLDTDLDGIGDACDLDDDNDGCNDSIDQHPKDASVRVGTKIHPLCPTGSSPIMHYEGDDSDGDWLPNCVDTDDDNDGIPDDLDPCPIHASQSCIEYGAPCPLYPMWNVCLLGGCNELLLRISSLINPDPTSTFLFSFQAVGNELVVSALPNKTLSESAKELVGGITTILRADRSDVVKMDIVKQDGSLVAELGTYNPDDAVEGNLTLGHKLHLTMPTQLIGAGETPLQIASTWAAGLAPGEVKGDDDGDRTPDFADNCLGLGNMQQRDSNRDGFGDLCDGDVDQDGVVTSADIALFIECEGVDLTAEPFGPEDGEDGPAPQVPNDFGLAVRQSLCVHMDLNNSGVVDEVDTDIAKAGLGKPPGPSGVASFPESTCSIGSGGNDEPSVTGDVTGPATCVAKVSITLNSATVKGTGTGPVKLIAPVVILGDRTTVENGAILSIKQP